MKLTINDCDENMPRGPFEMLYSKLTNNGDGEMSITNVYRNTKGQELIIGYDLAKGTDHTIENGVIK